MDEFVDGERQRSLASQHGVHWTLCISDWATTSHLQALLNTYSVVAAIHVLSRIFSRRPRAWPRLPESANELQIPEAVTLVLFVLCGRFLSGLDYATCWVSLYLALSIRVGRFLCQQHDRGWVLLQADCILLLAATIHVSSRVLPCAVVSGACLQLPAAAWAIVTLSAVLLLDMTTPQHMALPSSKHASKGPAPEQLCSPAGRWLTYGWITPLIYGASQQRLSWRNIPHIPWYDDPALVFEKWREATRSGQSLLKSLLLFARWEVAIMALYATLVSMLELVAPFSMYRLLQIIAHPEGSNVRPSVWLALMFLASISRSLIYNRWNFVSSRLAVRITSALTMDLYGRAMSSMQDDATLLVEQYGRKPDEGVDAEKKSSGVSSTGRMANFVSADIPHAHAGRDVIRLLFGVTTGILISLVGLYYIVGWTALVGTAVLVLGAPFSAWVAGKVHELQELGRDYQDSRISLIAEYLGAIKTVKYFAWEDAAIERINKARTLELQNQWAINFLYIWPGQLSQLVPYFALLVVFWLQTTIARRPLDAATGFTTVLLLNNVKTYADQIGRIVGDTTKSAIAIRRLDNHFRLSRPKKQYPGGPLRITDGSFARGTAPKFVLRGIDIDFTNGGLNVVTGASGSGKSTLLLGILGEITCDAGVVTRPADVGYASQSAWLLNRSLRDNILFSASFEQDRYAEVVDACCLSVDFDELPWGDQTDAGESGNSLSGGQRARIALARALYSQAPLLLLDDIFSALDAKTASLLWDKCFCSGVLRDRTVVLVTQLPWVAAQADLLVTMDRGTIRALKKQSIQRRPRNSPSGSTLQVSASFAGNDADALSRSIASVQERHNLTEKTGNDKAHLTDSSGRLSLCFKYIRYMGSPIFVALCFALLITSKLASFIRSVWLSQWVDMPSGDDLGQMVYSLGIYAIMSIMESALYTTACLAFSAGSWNVSHRLHTASTGGVMRAPLSWYGSTAVGKVLNRFSRDVDILDNTFVWLFRAIFDNCITLLFRLGAVSSVLPIFTIPAGLASVLGVAIGELYTRAAVILTRLVASSYSPVLSHFTDSLNGLAVIRAREGLPERFTEELAEKLRVWSAAQEAHADCHRWVSVRLDFISTIISLAAGIVAVWRSSSVPAGIIALSLSSSTDLGNNIIELVRLLSQLSVDMQSFDRLEEYANLDAEEQDDPAVVTSSTKQPMPVPKDWPRNGLVEFRNVTIRHAVDGPDVLSEVSLAFGAGERVAIVGRTGAGKSTLGLSLLRFTHVVGGGIIFGGVDIRDVPRRRLRESITFIPQDAVLVHGTVRENLDPLGQVPEHDLRMALKFCMERIDSFNHGNSHRGAGRSGVSAPGEEKNPSKSVPEVSEISLSTRILPGGGNLSHGQRQVLSLCRALVRRSKIMLLDEATASMDYRTDQSVQQIIREHVAATGGGCTVVIIAHRLRTVLDYDKLVVMASGRVAEVGAPRDLYRAGGLFHDMVCHSGEADLLRKLLE